MNYNLRTWFFVSPTIYCLTFFAESIGGIEYARIVDGRTKHVATSAQRPTAVRRPTSAMNLLICASMDVNLMMLGGFSIRICGFVNL